MTDVSRVAADTPLPYSFDLFFDAKCYGDIETQYLQACEAKHQIEELCHIHQISLPTDVSRSALDEAEARAVKADAERAAANELLKWLYLHATLKPNSRAAILAHLEAKP